MTNHNHVAYNKLTGEVLTANTGNALKRFVARVEHRNIADGYGKGEWVFAHGTNAIDKMRNKV